MKAPPQGRQMGRRPWLSELQPPLQLEGRLVSKAREQRWADERAASWESREGKREKEAGEEGRVSPACLRVAPKGFG